MVVKKLLYMLTGGIQASLAAGHVALIKERLPEVELLIGATPNALRFVTPLTLTSFGHCPVVIDDWDVIDERIHHVELADWADGIIIHPLTADYLSKLAVGAGSGPLLLALQSTSAPMVLCPGMPPGAWANPSVQDNIRSVSRRDNVTILPPVVGASARTGMVAVGACAEVGDAIRALHETFEESAPA